MPTHHADLRLRFSSSTSKIVHDALRPEAGSGVPKTRSTLAHDADALSIAIEADDLSSLRAALNSYLRWTDAAERAARLER